MRFKTIIVYAGYIVAFFASLYFFVIIGLPKEQIASYINNKYIKPAGVNLLYKSADISYSMNLVFNEAEVEIPDVNQKLVFERIEIGISVIEYLFGSKPFLIRSNAYGGNIKIAAGTNKEKVFLSVVTDDLDVSKLDIVKEKTGLNIRGLLNLDLDISYDKKESKNNKGSINIEFKGLEIKSGTIMGFQIPPVNSGDLLGEIEIREGKFKITNFKAKGKDVEIKLLGDGAFLSPVSRSNLNLSLKVKPTQAFIDREEKLKTILFGIGSSLDKEGFYNFSIKGTISSPSFNIEKK